MSRNVKDLNPVSRITIGAVGEPGQRMFLLQASQSSSDSMTLKIEKEQARVLAVSTTELLEELDEKYPRSFSKVDRPLTSDLMLREPLEPDFVVGQIGLGYDQDQDMVVLVVQEIQLDADDEVATARFWATRSQMEALSEHTLEVVNQGRPICPLCDSPIDPEGHFCPKSNGFERVQWN